jgi:hypothetical protein
VPKIAQIAYDQRAFDRLPILLDALTPAGCTNEDIRSHCRSGYVSLLPKHARRFSSMLANSNVSKPLLS